MPRLIAIGDIHGQYTKLRNLIDKLDLGPGDEVVFLGDYVDSGPQSADVIEYLREGAKYRKWWFLMGNHDAWFLDYLESGYADPSWQHYGGRDTLMSYGAEWPRPVVPHEHKDWLQRLSRPIIFEPSFGDVEYIFSHGMLCPTKPLLGRFDKHEAMWGRPKTFGIESPDSLPTKPLAWEDNQFLVFGHTPHTKPTFYSDGNRNYALCIDTVAKLDDFPLTAAILPHNMGGSIEFVQATNRE